MKKLRPYPAGVYPISKDHPEYPLHKSQWAAAGVDIERPSPHHRVKRALEVEAEAAVLRDVERFIAAYGPNAVIASLHRAGVLPLANLPPVDNAEREIFRLISNEVARARNLMPARHDMFVALTEELGEVAKALIDQKYKTTGTDFDVLTELVQVAAVAVRIATEGDAGFLYEPPPEIRYARRKL